MWNQKISEIQVTLLGARPAKTFAQLQVYFTWDKTGWKLLSNINYNYALTNRWGVRPPSPAKEAKKTLIAQTCFKNVADDRHMEKKLKSGRWYWAQRSPFLIEKSMILSVFSHWFGGSLPLASCHQFSGPDLFFRFLWAHVMTHSCWLERQSFINET